MRIICFLFVIATGLALADEVTTTDGQRIRLNADGTYIILSSTAPDPNQFVTSAGELFEHHTSEYSQRTVRFMPIFTNHTDRHIVAIKFKSTFKDPFGDVAFEFSGKSTTKIVPGGKSRPSLFYGFEDNQFIAEEPYDKLLPFVANETGSVATVVTAIAFQNGESVTFD